jgi:hypothetical protein
VIEDHAGLVAHGTAIGMAAAGGTSAYVCRYELRTDPAWITRSMLVEAAGAGWRRTLRLERTGGEWRIRASEEGSLDASQPGTARPELLDDAIDVDLLGSPLFNTLPVRRLGLLTAPVGHRVDLLMAWIDLPSLVVSPSRQRYETLGDARIRFSAGPFSAVIDLDEHGYVRRYPGVAEAV